MSYFWVHHRGQCNIRKTLNELLVVVKGDVESANELDRPLLKFEVESDEHRFLVRRLHDQESVVFVPIADRIDIFQIDKTEAMFSIFVEWNRETEECQVVCQEGNLRRAMEDLHAVSEKALYILFFP